MVFLYEVDEGVDVLNFQFKTLSPPSLSISHFGYLLSSIDLAIKGKKKGSHACGSPSGTISMRCAYLSLSTTDR